MIFPQRILAHADTKAAQLKLFEVIFGLIKHGCWSEREHWLLDYDMHSSKCDGCDNELLLLEFQEIFVINDKFGH